MGLVNKIKNVGSDGDNTIDVLIRKRRERKKKREVKPEIKRCC